MDKRFYYIDALRVIAILMMFVFHVLMVFVAEWSWHIKNPEVSHMLLEINFWMSSFRMPVLFFVAGYISYILMQRMSWQAFAVLRFKRLLIPTFLWTFLLVAPQIYFERKLQGVSQDYWEFYQSFLQFQWWPEGNFHWLHLWFIPYLFCYNLLSLPIFRLLKGNKQLVQFLEAFFQKRYALFLFVFIAILPYTFLYPIYNASYDLINDWARHTFFFFFMVAGLLFFRFPQLSNKMSAQRRRYLTLAFLSILAINIIRWNGLEPFTIYENWQNQPQTYLYLALLNFNTWMWVFTSLGYGKKYLNRGSQLLRYANAAVYPFYILHQTVIVVIAYYVVQREDALSLKLVFLLVICFVITVLIYHLFIRPYNWIRFLFGMKQSKP